MSLTVIIPTYNEEKSISACLESLQNQSQKALEIIVVDDGSTDKTKEIVGKYPVKFFERNHLGPGAARNFGAKKSIGKILVFVDADMTFDKDFLKNLITPITEGRNLGVFNSSEYVSNFDNVWARCWNYNQNLYSKERMNPDDKEESEDFRAILKSEFERVGGFSLTGYMDSRTLVPKLGYRPFPVSTAISYHNNPESLREIYFQSRWIGKRKTKFGPIGQIVNLIRYSFPVSVLLGLLKAIKTKESRFLVFKIVYDFGFEVGIVSSLIGLSTAK